MSALQIKIFEHVLNHDSEFREKIKTEAGRELANLTASISQLNSFADEPKDKPKPISKQRANKMRMRAEAQGDGLSHKDAVANFLKARGKAGATSAEIVKGLSDQSHKINKNLVGWYLKVFRDGNSIRQEKAPDVAHNALRYYWK